MGNKETRETEFGYRKRCGEAALRESGIGHRIVRAASIDELLIEEGLEVQGLDEGDLVTTPDGEGEEGGAALATPSDVASRAAGLTQENLEDNRIHPRDIARTLVASLFGAADGRTTEVWTVEESRKDQMTNSNVLKSSPCNGVSVVGTKTTLLVRYYETTWSRRLDRRSWNTLHQKGSG